VDNWCRLEGFDRPICKAAIQAFGAVSPDVRGPKVIQAKIIPAMFFNKYSFLVESSTGSGKTIGVILGFLTRMDREIHSPQCVIICITKDMVIKFGQEAHKIFDPVGVKVGVFYSRASELNPPVEPQSKNRSSDLKSTKKKKSPTEEEESPREALQKDMEAQMEKLRTSQVVIATPGQLLSSIKLAERKGKPIVWNALKFWVIDEVDKAVEKLYEGNHFKQQTYDAFEKVAPHLEDRSVQLIAVSATMSKSVTIYLEDKSSDFKMPNLQNSLMADKSKNKKKKFPPARAFTFFLS